MKKTILLLGVAIIAFVALPSSVLAGDCNATQPGCINTVDLADGAATNAKLATDSVTTVKILDNSVTAAKIADGPDSGLNADLLDGLDSTEFTKKYENVIVIAKSGGDYTTIQAAIDSLDTPNTTPTVIKVMPGIYTENITLKSNIHLMGSGREVTTIQPQSYGDLITISGVSNIAITGLTVTGSDLHGIYAENSSNITIRENDISGNGVAGAYKFGALVTTCTSVVISDNIFSDNTSGSGGGIWISESVPSSPAKIIGNTIKGNNSGVACHHNCYALISGNLIIDNPVSVRASAVSGKVASPIISENTISGGYTSYGAILFQSNASAIVTNNNISASDGSVGIDLRSGASSHLINNRFTYNSAATHIDLASGSSAHISFNVVDSINGTTGYGSYNVDSNGNPITVP